MSTAKSPEEIQADPNSSKGRTIHLVSQEGESYDVPLQDARMSELVKTMIDGY